MKKTLILSIGLGLLLFTGCGSSSSTKTETNNDRPAEQEEAREPVAACATDGDMVVVDEGTTCKDGSDTLSCNNNVVTYNGAISSPTIQINGRTYVCN